MSAYNDTIKAMKPDLYEPLDTIPRRMRSREEIFESIAAVTESPQQEQSATLFAILEVLLDVRDLQQGKRKTGSHPRSEER